MYVVRNRNPGSAYAPIIPNVTVVLILAPYVTVLLTLVLQ